MVVLPASAVKRINKMWRKRLIRIVVFFFFFFLISVYVCDKLVSNQSIGKLFNDANNIPFNKTGLLLGTSKFGANGYRNLYYVYRIDAAVKLFRQGKIKYLIVSGDNGRKEYNEPETMRADLISAGIDSSKIFLDYAGFRTFDSVVRLKEIFGQDAVTIISQPFHNERAIYIATGEKINAIGFNAKDVNSRVGMKTQIREKLARVKVIIDFWFGKKPKFLGNKIQIPG